MEYRLFFIGLMMGAFAWASRRWQKKGGPKTPRASALCHALFFSLAGFSIMLILSISFEDDDINTKNGIDHLHSSYPNVVRRHYHPKDVGQSRIGHFGFFNERCREPLWDECLDWLRRSVSASIPTVRIPSRA